MLLILLNVPSGCSEVSRREIVALSMMIESDTRFDSLSVWLDDLNYSKFTFVLWEGAEDNILNNSTRVAKLEEYGEIIPRRCYIQEYTPSTRKAKIDAMITKYNDSLGYVPKGMMDYMPDTYTVQYLLERNFSYVQGYCFDQWVIDYMSDRGVGNCLIMLILFMYFVLILIFGVWLSYLITFGIGSQVLGYRKILTLIH